MISDRDGKWTSEFWDKLVFNLQFENINFFPSSDGKIDS
jgi:hypothetical protein